MGIDSSQAGDSKPATPHTTPDLAARRIVAINKHFDTEILATSKPTAESPAPAVESPGANQDPNAARLPIDRGAVPSPPPDHGLIYETGPSKLIKEVGSEIAKEIGPELAKLDNVTGTAAKDALAYAKAAAPYAQAVVGSAIEPARAKVDELRGRDDTPIPPGSDPPPYRR